MPGRHSGRAIGAYIEHCACGTKFFDANASDPGPSVAIAHYDPQTGQYATPDGTVAQQTDLVDPPKSWQDLIFKAAP
jgi:hypothetical protein